MAQHSSTSGSVNPNLQRRPRRERPVKYYVEGILARNGIILSQAITLVESTRLADQAKARKIVEACLPHSGKSFRLGVTGVPGVGKSTFIETFGQRLVQRGNRLAVLTVDPSSSLSRGSILGDKTRMEQLARHHDVYIRPSPAGTSLGGVAAKTRELILLCEAAGYDFIIVETVGVGQSETAVYHLTDLFLLLLLPGGGDELQGIKRGVVEMADIIAINKADEDRIEAAKQARATYQRALHLFPPKSNGWTAKAVTCSALSGDGLDQLVKQMDVFHQTVRNNGHFTTNRQQQALFWFEELLRSTILQQFLAAPQKQQLLTHLRAAIKAGETSPQAAVEQIIKG